MRTDAIEVRFGRVKREVEESGERDGLKSPGLPVYWRRNVGVFGREKGDEVGEDESL